jgi:hypothetical protein
MLTPNSLKIGRNTQNLKKFLKKIFPKGRNKRVMHPKKIPPKRKTTKDNRISEIFLK